MAKSRSVAHTPPHREPASPPFRLAHSPAVSEPGATSIPETVWFLCNGVCKTLFAGLLDAFAKEVGAGPHKRVVLVLNNAGFHTRPNLAVPDGLRLVYPPPCSPELQPAETLWSLVDEPIVNKLVPSLEDLTNTIDQRCRSLTEHQSEISSPTNFSWWPKNHTLELGRVDIQRRARTMLAA